MRNTLADPAPALRSYILGPPRFEWAGQPLPIPRRQVRALLMVLAAGTASRQELHLLFWPDAPEATARRALTRLLTHLRRALPCPDLLCAVDDRVALDPLRAWSDVAEFHQLCALRDPARRPDAQRQAIALYRGPFLSGFALPDCPEFEAWALREQAILERAYLEALEALIEACAAQGALAEAIACAQRYLETDVLAEKIHLRLIQLYARQGDRNAALRQFERCVTVLERELGVSPLPETRGAYEAALRGAPRGPHLPAPLPPPEGTSLPSLDAPFVGRSEPLKRLQQACERARQGHGGALLIAGEPGIGKSRLLQELAASLAPPALLIAGSAHEAEDSLPYWPLLEALRPHALASPQALLEIEPLYLAEVARLLPETRALNRDLPTPPPTEPAQARARLFLALVQWLCALAARQPPLILCLDDLHWADEATLAWLGYLIRRIRMMPVLLVGTYRSGEAEALSGLRTELARHGLLDEILLEGLPWTEVLRLVRHLSGMAAGAVLFSQRLHRETGGNPFFLLETLRAMFETGALWQDEGGWSTALDATTEDYRELPLPGSVALAIRDRLSRLSIPARQVLDAAAVIGPRFSLRLVRQTSGRSEAEVVDALETLLARQILAERGGSYRFCHDLIRTTVTLDLSYGRRRLLHSRAAAALLAARSDDVAALAHHFEQADEPQRAAIYALRAGERARDVYAHVEARAYFDRALTLLQRDAGRLRDPAKIAANQRLQLQALEERGWAFRLLGEMEAYARDSQEVGRLAALLGDGATLAKLRRREAYTHRWFCRYAEARAAAEACVCLCQASGDRLTEALCRRELGMAARATGDNEAARAAFEEALRLFAELGEIVCEIHTLGNLSTLCCSAGKPAQALEIARRALARCDGATGLALERRLPLGDMGAAAAALGDEAQARAWLEESLGIAHRIADRTQEILCLGHLGWLALAAERAAEALLRLDSALALAESIDSRTEQSWLHAGLAEAHWLAGRGEEAAAHAQRALALAQETGRACDRALAQRVLESSAAR